MGYMPIRVICPYIGSKSRGRVKGENNATNIHWSYSEKAGSLVGNVSFLQFVLLLMRNKCTYLSVRIQRFLLQRSV